MGEKIYAWVPLLRMCNNVSGSTLQMTKIFIETSEDGCE